MMDDASLETLSRFLDGDLTADEVRQLEERLEVEQALAARLDALRRTRDSVAALAASERAPAELDKLIEPLLRERPQAVAARPWVRWLATAAAIVLGLTVIVEVNRRGPAVNIGSIARTAEKDLAESGDRFELAPLPTSSLPPSEQPLGASDRLLASPIPEVEFEEPPPLEVLGPIDDGRRLDAGDARSRQKVLDRVTDAAAASVTADAAQSDAERPAPAERREGLPAGVDEKEDPAKSSGRTSALQSWEEDAPRGLARLFVFIDGESAWREFEPTATCKPGRYTVRIVVGNGAVREARPVGGAASASPTQRLCAAELVIGLDIDDVPDGEYPAEVVVERRGVDSD